ncbi:hypothetical protein DL96DRAFT_1531495 [Flagelloscypha sp. PMI_526]|nr:hypothetical protein DL96DRAFT_1531495 [Flagelloscypha sp. PMI_526]
MDPSNAQTRPEDCQRVDGLWYDDGGIILLAGNKIFKIYRGFLATRSAFFSDMLSLPQPRNPEDDYDGCPLVRMPDDSSELEAYLRAVFDSEYLPSLGKGNNWNDLLQLISIANLSHKYSTPILHQNVLQVLSKLFPSTLTEFRSLDHRHLAPISSLIRAIPILVQIRADWCLPSAYYMLARGVKLEELVLLFQGAELATLLRGARRQFAFYARILQVFADMPACGDKRCELYGKILLKTYVTIPTQPSVMDAFGLGGVCDPLGILQLEDWAKFDTSKFSCSQCPGKFKELLLQARAQIWARLPGLYGLPDWKDLETKRDEAMGVPAGR